MTRRRSDRHALDALVAAVEALAPTRSSANARARAGAVGALMVGALAYSPLPLARLRVQCIDGDDWPARALRTAPWSTAPDRPVLDLAVMRRLLARPGARQRAPGGPHSHGGRRKQWRAVTSRAR